MAKGDISALSSNSLMNQNLQDQLTALRKDPKTAAEFTLRKQHAARFGRPGIQSTR
jgi:hypothetical protein